MGLKPGLDSEEENLSPLLGIPRSLPSPSPLTIAHWPVAGSAHARSNTFGIKRHNRKGIPSPQRLRMRLQIVTFLSMKTAILGVGSTFRINLLLLFSQKNKPRVEIYTQLHFTSGETLKSTRRSVMFRTVRTSLNWNEASCLWITSERKAPNFPLAEQWISNFTQQDIALSAGKQNAQSPIPCYWTCGQSFWEKYGSYCEACMWASDLNIMYWTFYVKLPCTIE